MKTSSLILIFGLLGFIISCHMTKKSSTPKTSAVNTVVGGSAPAPSSSEASTIIAMEPMGPFSIYHSEYAPEPGNSELVAMQSKYKDITLDVLKQGYGIYAQGACIKCHPAKNINERDDVKWVGILGDMAMRAHLSEIEKDAVYKYILAIKATQTKK